MYSERDGKVKKAVHFTEADWKAIEKRAAVCKLNTTKYIRKIAIEGEVAVYDFKAAHELIYEIHKIGVNVNQLARKANEIHNIYKSDIDDLKQDYENLCHLLNKFLLEIPVSKN